MQTEHWVAANPQTKPTDLGCESADKWLLPFTSTVAICYYPVIIHYPNIHQRNSSFCLFNAGNVRGMTVFSRNKLMVHQRLAAGLCLLRGLVR